MPESDLTWLSLLVFLPAAFAVGLVLKVVLVLAFVPLAFGIPTIYECAPPAPRSGGCSNASAHTQS